MPAPSKIIRAEEKGADGSQYDEKMIHRITKIEQIEPAKLMGIYQESNQENISYFYPDEPDQKKALRKVEEGFLQYIEKDFLSADGNAYWVLEKENKWVSAVRLNCLSPGSYYLEALETHPDYRNRGYACELLNSLVKELKKDGPFEVMDCVSKKNEASIRTHLKCGFQIVSECGIDYLSGSEDERDYGMRLAYIEG